MERASVWLDDINGKGPPYEKPSRRFDFLKIFQFMHGVNIPYNPEGIQLQGLDALLPLYERSAEFLLDMAWDGLKATTPTTEKLEDPFCSVPPPVSSFSLASYSEGTVNAANGNFLEVSHPDEYRRNTGVSARSSQVSTDAESPVGTVLSLNFYLRMVIHLVADIHQPLHSLLAFSPAFPHGDRFGTKISMVLPNGKDTNLHAFWDGAGSVYTKRRGEFTDEEIAEEARRIKVEFPKDSLESHLKPELLAPNFRNMAEESHRLGAALAYREFNFRTFRPADLPYVPTHTYLADVRLACRRQIAIAGYRLGYALEELSAYLPVPEFLQNHVHAA
ncbi:s1/P1 nuclease [Toxoplasma gondii RUB]|uniref:S1/P1 nuclease n=1 Tax=Toxoplasma gondii RUB TaxID=935652 RepID=A0A086M9X7_TOXGO|nr:s1/P1 nuclease [Toxoplasma gondii RUB]